MFVKGPLAAARALRLEPLLLAGRADAAGLERVPEVQAAAGPPIVGAGLPAALGAPDAGIARVPILAFLEIRNMDRRRLALEQMQQVQME
jgi:hypothetical protein